MAAIRQARQARNKKFEQQLLDKIGDSPDPGIELELYVNAYLDLDTEREWLSPIPWSKIAFYCIFNQLSEDQTWTMIELIRRVDNAIVVARNKKAKADAES
jgi:hypothetical protein